MGYDVYSEPYEGPSVNMINSQIRTAKYPHKCALCDQPIQPGDTYKRQIWTEDGELRVMKSHNHGCAWEAYID